MWCYTEKSFFVHDPRTLLPFDRSLVNLAPLFFLFSSKSFFRGSCKWFLTHHSASGGVGLSLCNSSINISLWKQSVQILSFLSPLPPSLHSTFSDGGRQDQHQSPAWCRQPTTNQPPAGDSPCVLPPRETHTRGGVQ